MKILLISPGTPDEIDNLIIRGIPYLYARAFTAPHAVATVAALTPPEHEVSIHDEYMRGPVEHVLKGMQYDLIGISVTSNQLNRSLEIAGHCRALCPQAVIVAGGIGVETLLNNKKAAFDVVFSGEAEETWPQFLEEIKRGTTKKLYRTVSKPDLNHAPAPRWELLGNDIIHYNSVSLQTTRGCPFDCSFCDVIYVYGRKPRSKSIPQILAEVTKLSELGVQMLFIADDNFAGDRKFVKELLHEMVVLNNTLRSPVGYFTQLDLGIADDEELLKLLADANFYTLMIGVESASQESLKDLNKKQNMNISIKDAIDKIQSYGMVVLAHMIIGADSDDTDVFERTAEFIQDANIVFHICHPLAAPPGTKLWYDLKRQGRIIHMQKEGSNDQFDILSNIIPKKLSRDELFSGLATYWETIYSPELFLKRALGYLDAIRYQPKLPSGPKGSALKITGRFLRHGLFEAKREDRKVFMQLLRRSFKNPAHLFPKIIYLYSFYLIDRRRSVYDARMAREHVAWEQKHPEQILIDDSMIPVSEHIRNHARAITHTVYQRVREKVYDKDTLYQTVLNALSDFNDRFGNTIEDFDDYHREQLLTCCDRVLHDFPDPKTDTENPLPLQPYPGFTREIIDALDNAVRYRESQMKAELEGVESATLRSSP